MFIQTYSAASEFLSVSRPFLIENEVTNSLILGICIRIEQHPGRLNSQPYFATVHSSTQRDANDLLAVAVMTPPHNLLLSCEEDEPSSILGTIATNLLENEWPVPGTVGRKPLVEAFLPIWANMTGRSAHLLMSQRVFELRKVNPIPYSPGYMRVATEDDMELVAEWIYAFGREALDEDNKDQAWGGAEFTIANQAMHLWIDEVPVAMAAWARPTMNGITVNSVYTPPELRGKGYASSCVAKLSQSLLDSGWQFCTLFTDLANLTSNSIYQKIGYQPVCDFVMYQIGDKGLGTG